MSDKPQPLSGAAPAPQIHLFYRLWDKAVGKDGYSKGEWQTLERFILAAPVAVPAGPRCNHCQVELIGTEILCHECTRTYREAATQETMAKVKPAPLPPPQEPRTIQQSGTTHAEASETLRKASEAARDFLYSTERLKLDPNPHEQMFYITAPQLAAYASERTAAALAGETRTEAQTDMDTLKQDLAELNEKYPHHRVLIDLAGEWCVQHTAENHVESLVRFAAQFRHNCTDPSCPGGLVERENRAAASRIAQLKRQKSALMEAIEPFVNIKVWSLGDKHYKAAARVYEQVKEKI